MFLAIPGRKQPWPKRAACWSPAIPATGTDAPSTAGSLSQITPEEGTTSGSRAAGTPIAAKSASSQQRLRMSNSSVRDAFVKSVAWTRPPESFQSNQVSMVPNARSPRSARRRTPSTLSSSHRIFVPEKYGSITSPVFFRIAPVIPFRASSSQNGVVRRSCQTIAR